MSFIKNYDYTEKEAVKTSRLAIIAGIMAFVMLIFSFRLIELQLVKGADFKSQVDSNFTSKTPITAARGEIVDRYGRLLATNKTTYNIIFYKVYMPSKSEDINKNILQLVNLMKKNGEKWIDNLPISKDSDSLSFSESMENSTANLKKFLKLNTYATVEDVLDNLKEKYKIDKNYSADESRTIAGIRYEMERTGFSFSVNYTFAQNISSKTLTELKETNYKYPGVDVEQEPIREYVSADIAAHVIGTTGPIYQEEYKDLKDKGYPLNATIGKSGIESVYEEVLRGTDGIRRVVKNKQGDIIEDQIEKEPVPGGIVSLTIDKFYQKFVQDALAKNMQQIVSTRKGAQGGKGASAVVINTKTFEVLALANYPTYDINEIKTNYNDLLNAPNNPLFNRASQGVYRPGSIFKPGVGAVGLSNGVISANETVNCTRVYHAFEGYSPVCQGFHGNTNIHSALSVSCNIFFYEVGRRLGIDVMNKGVSMFGFGQKTGIQIYESQGQLASPEIKKAAGGGEWYPGDTVQAAIGQLDTSVTPLQLAVYTATLANSGERLKTSIVNEVKSYDYSKTIFKNEKEILSKFENNNNALEEVKKGMVKASRSGSATGAFQKYPFDVAAKTGSPQISHDTSSGTYIAYGPADDPEIAVAVVAEEITHGYYLSNLMKEIFDYYFFTKTTNEEIRSSNELIP